MISAERSRITGRITVKRLRASQVWIYAVLSVFFVSTVYGFITIDTKGIDLVAAGKQTLEYFRLMFTSARGVHSHFQVYDGSDLSLWLKSFNLVVQTLSLAFLTTLIGGISALVLAFFAAKNLTNSRVSNTIKGFVALIRAGPTVLWVLVFAIGAGLGSVAAVIGMSFHTVGYLLKAYSESFEEIDAATIEALRASGASWLHIIFQAVLPATVPQILSWSFIRLEINFAVAVAMGAAAGAGGIGYNVYIASSYFYDIREIGFITYQILAVAFVMEIIATRLKNRYHLQ
jgi:phosphonate transport system permease protein